MSFAGANGKSSGNGVPVVQGTPFSVLSAGFAQWGSSIALICEHSVIVTTPYDPPAPDTAKWRQLDVPFELDRYEKELPRRLSTAFTYTTIQEAKSGQLFENIFSWARVSRGARARRRSQRTLPCQKPGTAKAQHRCPFASPFKFLHYIPREGIPTGYPLLVRIIITDLQNLHAYP